MAKLADVGLVTHVAEARRDPKHLGTEGFTPPEGPGTLWADVYSLGKVLCEASMGHASVQDSLPPPDEKEQKVHAAVLEFSRRPDRADRRELRAYLQVQL